MRADEALAELETDKVTLEVNAPASGVLAEIVAKQGETVTAGALLGQIREGAARARLPLRSPLSPARKAPPPPQGPRRPTGRRPRCRLRRPPRKSPSTPAPISRRSMAPASADKS